MKELAVKRNVVCRIKRHRQTETSVAFEALSTGEGDRRGSRQARQILSSSPLLAYRCKRRIQPENKHIQPHLYNLKKMKENILPEVEGAQVS